MEVNSAGELGKERQILTLAQMAQLLHVSARTVVRYRSEYDAYLNAYAPLGGGRGWRREALEVLKLIHELKSHRAHWSQIKQELDLRFGAVEMEPAAAGTKAFQRSLDAIRQSHQLLSSELRLLFRDLNRRLEALEENVKLLQARWPQAQPTPKEPIRQEMTPAGEPKVRNQSPRKLKEAGGQTALTENLFPTEPKL